MSSWSTLRIAPPPKWARQHSVRRRATLKALWVTQFAPKICTSWWRRGRGMRTLLVIQSNQTLRRHCEINWRLLSFWATARTKCSSLKQCALLRAEASRFAQWTRQTITCGLCDTFYRHKKFRVPAVLAALKATSLLMLGTCLWMWLRSPVRTETVSARTSERSLLFFDRNRYYKFETRVTIKAEMHYKTRARFLVRLPLRVASSSIQVWLRRCG